MVAQKPLFFGLFKCSFIPSQNHFSIYEPKAYYPSPIQSTVCHMAFIYVTKLN